MSRRDDAPARPPAGGEPFHNPYHFVPVKPHAHGGDSLTARSARDGKWADWSHARFQPGRLHGRMVARLRTIDPVVVGGAQSRESPESSARVAPFELDGEPAIPASTLKGMISSLAEAASQSAMRVLADTSLSYRVGIGDALSAIGVVVEAEPGVLALRPLTCPTFARGRDDGEFRPPRREAEVWPELFPDGPVFPVRFGNYRGREGAPDATAPFVTGCVEQGPYYRLKLDRLEWKQGGVARDTDCLHVKRRGDGPKERFFLIGQRGAGREPMPAKLAAPAAPGAGEQRGIVRALGRVGYKPEVPRGKKHELFIPLPDGWNERPLVTIPGEVLDTFHRLCDERTLEQDLDAGSQDADEAALLPYHPIGTARNDGKTVDPRLFRIKPGDLVYFGLDTASTPVEAKANQLSLSAVWRGSAGTASQYFDPEALPFNANRERITTAELMFGFVESRVEGGAGETEGALALAGRVRPARARLVHAPAGGPYLAPPEGAQRDGGSMLLKILSTPKPPSPALYFRPRESAGSTAAIRKVALNRRQHTAWGRKMYVHAQGTSEGPVTSFLSRDTDKSRRKQKNLVRPLAPGCEFLFHFDFENLTENQLGLLAYALGPRRRFVDAPSFDHKLGMGKAIGLGRVRIEIEGAWLVDRDRRYCSDDPFGAPRFHEAWLNPDVGGERDSHNSRLDELRSRYPVEMGSMEGDDAADSFSLARVFDEFSKNMDQETARYLETIGNPDAVKHPVHAPMTHEQQAAFVRSGALAEQETFKWFVGNERGAGASASLPPIERAGELPAMQTNAGPPAPQRRQPRGQPPRQGRRR